jgi:transposase-like protein
LTNFTLKSSMEQENFLRPLVEEIVQQVLEAEMDEVVGAEKGG